MVIIVLWLKSRLWNVNLNWHWYIYYCFFNHIIKLNYLIRPSRVYDSSHIFFYALKHSSNVWIYFIKLQKKSTWPTTKHRQSIKYHPKWLNIIISTIILALIHPKCPISEEAKIIQVFLFRYIKWVFK